MFKLLLLVELPLVEKELLIVPEHILSSVDLAVFVLFFSFMCSMF